MSGSQDHGSDITDPVLSLVRSTMALCKNTFKDSWKMCSNGQELKNMKVAAEAAMIKLIRSELIHLESNPLLEGVEVPEPTEATAEALEAGLKQFQDACNKKRQEFEDSLTVQKVKKHPQFTLLKQLMDQATEAKLKTADEPELETPELETSSSELIPMLDPVTRKTLRDPVRNKVCGHIYGKKGIMELLKNSKNIRCPQLGCQNRTFLRKEDLEEDASLNIRLQEQILSSESKPDPGTGRSQGGKRNKKLDDTQDLVDSSSDAE